MELPGAREPTIARERGLSALGSIAYWQREPEAALAPYEEALALSRELGDRRGEAEALYNLAFSRFIAGDLEEARTLLESAADRYRELGDEMHVAFANTGLGMMGYALGGDRDHYRALVEEALRTFRRRRQLWGISQSSSMVAALAKEDGDLRRAVSALRETLDANETLGHTIGTTVSLQGIALLAVDAGRPELGARLAGAIERVREESDHEAPPMAIGIVDPRGPLARVLPPERVSELWEQGRSLTLDEAVAEARAWLDEAIVGLGQDSGPPA